jgi:anti-anti-sigma factor
VPRGAGSDAVWVRPVGELDLATAEEVDLRLGDLRADGCDRLVIDLRGTTFIDSSAVNLLVTWHQRALRERFGVAVVGGPPAVQRVFEISGMYKVLRFVDGD